MLDEISKEDEKRDKKKKKKAKSKHTEVSHSLKDLRVQLRA